MITVLEYEDENFSQFGLRLFFVLFCMLHNIRVSVILIQNVDKFSNFNYKESFRVLVEFEEISGEIC